MLVTDVMLSYTRSQNCFTRPVKYQTGKPRCEPANLHHSLNFSCHYTSSQTWCHTLTVTHCCCCCCCKCFATGHEQYHHPHSLPHRLFNASVCSSACLYNVCIINLFALLFQIATEENRLCRGGKRFVGRKSLAGYSASLFFLFSHVNTQEKEEKQQKANICLISLCTVCCFLTNFLM